MLGVDAGEVADLVAAGGAGGDQDGALGEAAGGRKENPFADLSGDLEVVFHVAERAGHATAAAVEPGMRSRSDVAGTISPSDFWWQ